MHKLRHTTIQSVSLLVSAALAFSAQSDFGVLQSGDGGNTWQKTLGGTGVIDSVSSDPKGDLIAATAAYLNGPGMNFGIYRFTQDGNHWTKAELKGMPPSNGIQPNNVDIRALLPVSDGEFLAAGGSGVLRSSDGGGRWERISNPLEGATFEALAIGPQGRLLAGASNGIYESKDGGVRWLKLGLINKAITSMLVMRDGRILAATVGNGAFVSVNGGQSWARMLSLPKTTISKLAADNSGHVYAGVFGRGFFKSSDGGRTWTSILSLGNNTATYALFVTPSGEIFAAAGACCPVDSVYLSHSSDGGKTWNRILRVGDDTAIGSIVVNRNHVIFAGLTFVGE